MHTRAFKSILHEIFATEFANGDVNKYLFPLADLESVSRFSLLNFGLNAGRNDYFISRCVKLAGFAMQIAYKLSTMYCVNTASLKARFTMSCSYCAIGITY